MKNASFTPTERSLSCLSAHAVFWHDAFSWGRWETRNTSTSLCQAPPVLLGETLWWPHWQWQTDNGWMLHFTSLTFFSENASFFFSILYWAGERGQRLAEKITFSPPRPFYMKTHGLIQRTRRYRFTACCLRTHGWTAAAHHYPTKQKLKFKPLIFNLHVSDLRCSWAHKIWKRYLLALGMAMFFVCPPLSISTTLTFNFFSSPPSDQNTLVCYQIPAKLMTLPSTPAVLCV